MDTQPATNVNVSLTSNTFFTCTVNAEITKKNEQQNTPFFCDGLPMPTRILIPLVVHFLDFI